MSFSGKPEAQQKLKIFYFFISKAPWAHYPLVKAQKVINYRAPLYTIFSYRFWYSLFKVYKKLLEPFSRKFRKPAIFFRNLPLLGPKLGEGGLLKKICFDTKIVRAVSWESVLQTHTRTQHI